MLLWKAIPFTAVIALFCTTGQTAEIRFRNDLDKPYSLLYRTEAKAEFWPPLPLPSKSVVRFELRSAGKYFLVIQDQANRKKLIGWVNLNAIAAADPKAELPLSEVFMKEQYIKEQWVVEYVCERRIGLFGKVRYVRVPVYRMRRVSVEVVVRAPTFQVRIGDKLRPIWEFVDPGEDPPAKSK